MANPRRRANRNAMFQSLLNAGYDGGTAGAIANNPNWGAANNQFRNAMANAPGKPAPPPPAPPAPPPVPKAPVQAKATQASVGQGVRVNKRTKRRTKVSDLRISRQPAAPAPNANFAGGSGLNIGGY